MWVCLFSPRLGVGIIGVRLKGGEQNSRMDCLGTLDKSMQVETDNLQLSWVSFCLASVDFLIFTG